jgi:biopolymer transport protein TolQ
MEGGLDIYQILLESGIVVKSVLIILIASSVLSWAIILQKRKSFSQISLSNINFFNSFKVTNTLVEINSSDSMFPGSTLSIMYESGYEEFRKIKEELLANGKEKDLPKYLSDHGIDALERSLKQGANIANEKLENRLSTLASIGSITPFIGLFGTVWGIIDAFAGLASGGGSIEAVAPGIAEALVATAVGLFAAIPAVWGYNLLSARVNVFNSQMENFGQEFLNLIERTILISKDS